MPTLDAGLAEDVIPCQAPVDRAHYMYGGAGTQNMGMNNVAQESDEGGESRRSNPEKARSINTDRQNQKIRTPTGT